MYGVANNIVESDAKDSAVGCVDEVASCDTYSGAGCGADVNWEQVLAKRKVDEINQKLLEFIVKVCEQHVQKRETKDEEQKSV